MLGRLLQSALRATCIIDSAFGVEYEEWRLLLNPSHEAWAASFKLNALILCIADRLTYYNVFYSPTTIDASFSPATSRCLTVRAKENNHMKRSVLFGKDVQPSTQGNC